MEEKKSVFKNKKLIIILAVALVLVAGAVVFALTRPQAPVSINPDLDPNAVDWQGNLPEPENTVEGPSIAIPGYKSMTIKSNTKDVKVSLTNPEDNPCYFVITMSLENGKELYKSKMIEPGKGIYDITLNEELIAGEYNAVLNYETYSLENMSPMNGANIKFKLIVE